MAQVPMGPSTIEPVYSHPLTKREYMATHILAGLISRSPQEVNWHKAALDAIWQTDSLIQALSEKE